MKYLFLTSLMFFTVSALAGTTCPRHTKAVLTCNSMDGSQYDVCKKSFSKNYQIRINGEVFSQSAQKDLFDGLALYQGLNDVGVRFILEVSSKKTASLTEMDDFDMPLDEAIELVCKTL